MTVQSTDGDIPHGRELSISWLTGTVMTGLTSVLLMGAALFVSFQGQDTFSTAYEALQIANPPKPISPTNLQIKTNRVRPIAKPKSELETIEATIKETVDGRDIIKKQPFSRLRATLATAATSLSDDVPAYDPVALIAATQPLDGDTNVSTNIYGAEVEGEVSIKLASLPLTQPPPRAISDQVAADFVRTTVEGAYVEADTNALAYAPADASIHELSATPTDAVITGVAENLTAVPKTTLPGQGLGRTERLLTLREPSSLEETLKKNGFTADMIAMITGTLRNVYPSTNLPAGARLRILFGPSRSSESLIPYRMSIYIHDNATDKDRHAATVALTDRGQYVLATEPPQITFPEEDTEEINVANLPSIYRSIWETGRKHDLDDDTIQRIVAMYAYDLDLNKKIAPGDSIEILQTPPDATGHQDLLYVGLRLGTTLKELFRFRSDDGKVDFFDPSGESGKRFLTRRPLQGGGVVRSSFGWRVHPIFRKSILHTGVDLASKSGTPIYAAGDGVVEKAGWTNGYGKYVMIKHVNGFETGYGHMSRIADTTQPGTYVRQGQIIGYVGSTGNSTGPHLHFEILINGNFVDPLSVKLPRDKSLPSQFQQQFAQTVAQIRDLMTRDAAPITVASN
ncbi:peptidoglycan DD-metalloendopeptidase family protein [Devosia sp. D6-9]|nr:peptidoglycan DD-metalloendopeptidase family protein [Devosia sp. D6-9]